MRYAKNGCIDTFYECEDPWHDEMIALFPDRAGQLPMKQYPRWSLRKEEEAIESVIEN